MKPYRAHFRKEIIMDREDIIERLSLYFGLDTEDTESDEWQMGAYLDNGNFLSLAEVVKALED